MDSPIMSTLTELLDGPELTVEIGGEPYSFSEIPVGILVSLQGWVNKHTPHPLDSLKGHLDGLPEPVALALAEKARQEAKLWPPQIGTAAGAIALLGGTAGQKEALFVGLKIHQPEMTRERSDRIYRQIETNAMQGESLARRIFAVLFGQGDPERESDDLIPKASGIDSLQNGSRSTGA